MDPESLFENLKFNPFSTDNSVLIDNLTDPDVNLFNESTLQNLDTPFLNVEEAKTKLSSFKSVNSFHILHLNIRSLNKNFENFKSFLSTCSHTFSIICLTETWSSNDSFKDNSNFQLPGYNSIHQERSNNKRGGGICVYIQHSLMYKVIDELSISDKDNESLVIEIINERSKNTIINTSYRPPNGMIKPFKTHLKHIFEKNARSNKKLFCVGDYNLNCLDYNENTKVKNFFNLLFSYGMIPIINKPTRVTNKSATAIDNIFINSLYNNSLETGIIKTDISDHFPIFMAINNFDLSNYPSKLSFSKRIINDKCVTEFKNELANTNWNDVTKTTVLMKVIIIF